jgi:outer membrane protein assembly factor BamD (BamD/ComL family)
MKRLFALILFALLTTTFAVAVERGVSVLPVNIYISPDANSSKLATMERGHEIVVLERSGTWIHAQAEVTGLPLVLAENDNAPEGRTVSGWLQDKGVVRTNTPNGDRILFGEAADSEAEASRRRGRRGAAQDAMRLYLFLNEFFPNSPLAPEALYRGADIRWQLEKSDVMSRPSARERDAYLREGMEEDLMKKVVKRYPGTKWADLAAFSLIDNKLCGDWKGQSKCPEKESEMYEKYVNERPQSPNAPEALYDAAYRQSALIEIYKTERNAKKSDDARTRAVNLAQNVTSKYANSVDWSTRAQRLLFLIDQGVPTYGTVAASESGPGPGGPGDRP